MDASHGPYPGWQVPARDIHRLQVFDSSGRPVADRGSSYAGLGEYIATGLGDDATGNPYDYSPDPYLDPGGTSTPFYGSPGDSTFRIGPAATGAPSQWASVIANLANQWTAIGGRVFAPQTTYTVGPGGQVSYATPGSAPVPSILPTSLGGSSSLLWIGGAVAGLALLFALGKK